MKEGLSAPLKRGGSSALREEKNSLTEGADMGPGVRRNYCGENPEVSTA